MWLCASVERKVSTRALAFFRNALGSHLMRHISWHRSFGCLEYIVVNLIIIIYIIKIIYIYNINNK